MIWLVLVGGVVCTVLALYGFFDSGANADRDSEEEFEALGHSGRPEMEERFDAFPPA